MRIRFQNLGPIKDTVLDLQPLTVIIGPNNVGKTYLAYGTYGLWKQWAAAIRGGAGPAIVLGKTKFRAAMVDAAMKASPAFTARLPQFFRQPGMAPDASVAFESPKHIGAEAAERAWGSPAVRARRVLLLDLITQRDATPDGDPHRAKLDAQVAAWTRTVGSHVALAAVGEAVPMPAERNALVLVYRDFLDERTAAFLQMAERSPDDAEESPARRVFPEPIEDFFQVLRAMELANEAIPGLRPFRWIADLLIERLQDKQRVSWQASGLSGKELHLQISADQWLPFHNASSSMKQLAPLILHLHQARRKDPTLIVIDEPEMNLHPAAQAHVLEALAMLANAGIHVLVTTHSPYIMAHLNNLINGHATDAAVTQQQAENLYLGDSRAFLAPDLVSAYEMKDGALVSLKDPDYGIRWDTLSDVSADIQQRFFNITDIEASHGRSES